MNNALRVPYLPAAATLAALSVLLFSPSAEATTCVDICGAGPGDCTITSNEVIDAGSILDCSGRNLTIGGASGKLKVNDGFFTLIANDLTVNAGRFIIANEQTTGASTGVTIRLTGNLELVGGIKANNPSDGGSIRVEAEGYINIPENGVDGVEANGSSSGASGGDIELIAGGDVTVTCPVLADGNGSGVTNGGRISIRSGGDISTSMDGRLEASGRKAEGGSIELIAAGDITTGMEITVEGRGDEGDGGELKMVAGDALTISSDISVRGGVNAGGGASAGGSVQLDAGCGGIAINADIDTSGGESGSGENGGAVTAETIGDLSVGANVTIRTDSRDNGGDGGDVVLDAKGALTLNSNVSIDVTGDDAGGEEGSGASVELSGCTVELKSGATVDATGYEGGVIRISARDLPPATGTQPLLVSEFANLKVDGNTNDEDGIIELSPRLAQVGECSNDNTIECTLDVDCTVGCETGDCLYSNPDTEGVWTQFFGPDPAYASESSLAKCTAVCP